MILITWLSLLLIITITIQLLLLINIRVDNDYAQAWGQQSPQIITPSLFHTELSLNQPDQHIRLLLLIRILIIMIMILILCIMIIITLIMQLITVVTLTMIIVIMIMIMLMFRPGGIAANHIPFTFYAELSLNQPDPRPAHIRRHIQGARRAIARASFTNRTQLLLLSLLSMIIRLWIMTTVIMCIITINYYLLRYYGYQ